eukprot:355783-Chlamydomonas_euryale.AAC.2
MHAKAHRGAFLSMHYAGCCHTGPYPPAVNLPFHTHIFPARGVVRMLHLAERSCCACFMTACRVTLVAFCAQHTHSQPGSARCNSEDLDLLRDIQRSICWAGDRNFTPQALTRSKKDTRLAARGRASNVQAVHI